MITEEIIYNKETRKEEKGLSELQIMKLAFIIDCLIKQHHCAFLILTVYHNLA